jgi:hypothetical protein
MIIYNTDEQDLLSVAYKSLLKRYRLGVLFFLTSKRSYGKIFKKSSKHCSQCDAQEKERIADIREIRKKSNES